MLKKNWRRTCGRLVAYRDTPPWKDQGLLLADSGPPGRLGYDDSSYLIAAIPRFELLMKSPL